MGKRNRTKMDCFVKKIFLGKTDEQVHSQFTRFGKGRFPGRAALSLSIGEKIKISGSFEFANDFVNFVSQNVDAKFSGIVMSRKEIGEFGKTKEKNGVYEYEVEGVSSGKIKEILQEAYYLLLDGGGEEITLKIKKKLPKPGKSGEVKIDDKFCVIEANKNFLPSVKEAFFWDVGECKKAKVLHEYIIEEIIYPEGEKDFEKIRLLAKRKGKILRKLSVDGKESVKEKEFEV